MCQVAFTQRVAKLRRGTRCAMPRVNPEPVKIMALRDFTDSSGNRWRVWNVAPHVPSWGSDASAERPSTSANDGGGESMLQQRRLVPGLEGGWLCFETEE